MSIWARWRNLVGQEIFSTFGFWGMVAKSPSGGGGVTKMVRLPCLESVMTQDYFLRCRQQKILLISYGV